MKSEAHVTRISRTFRLESAHRLPNVPPGHKCERLHGHSFTVEVIISGTVDPHTGWIMDFADIEKAFAPLHRMLDHQYLNEIEGLENPTSENLAHWILHHIQLEQGSLHAIKVHETCTSACVVYAKACPTD